MASAMLLSVVGVANSQGVKLWDQIYLNGANGTFVANATLGNTVTIEGEAGREIHMKQQWGQFGQKFTVPKSWGVYTGYGIALKNTSNDVVELGFRVCTDANLTKVMSTVITLQPGESTHVVMDTRNWNLMSPNMRRPLPIMQSYYKHLFSNQSLPTNEVYEWQVYYRNTKPVTIVTSSMYGYKLSDTYKNVVDAYGQHTDRTWTEKITDFNHMNASAMFEEDDLMVNPGPNEVHGSKTLPGLPATGKWRTIKQNGKWYLVTPKGKRFWSLGVTSVYPESPTAVEGRESMFQYLPAANTPKGQFYGTVNTPTGAKKSYDFYRSNLFDKYGSNWMTKWQQRSNARLKSWGFNTLGSGSDANLYAVTDMPYVITVDTKQYPNRLPGASDIPEVFGADFQNWMTNKWKDLLTWYGRNENFIGVYSDTELNWGARYGTTREKYRVPLAVLTGTKDKNPSKNEFVKQLCNKYSSIANFNSVYGTSYKAWADVYNTPIYLTDAQIEKPQVKQDLSAFLANFSKFYYYKMKIGLHNTGYQRLYLGARDILWTTPDEVLTNLETYADVASFTFYDDAKNIPWDVFGKLNKPVLIAEFSFMARDKNSSSGSLNDNIVTRTQAERAAKARAYLDSALKQPNCVGVHWFTYVDQPITGRPDGENYSFGLVDVTDTPQMEMVNMFRSFTSNMYQVRGM
jgi:hypothetical protein